MAFTNNPHLHANNQSRAQLRRDYQQQRRQLSASEQNAAAARISQHLMNWVNATQPAAVAVFLAANGEPSLSPFIQALWQRNITVAVPVLHPVCAGHLLFLRYTAHTEMVANRFAILEPRLSCQAIVPLAQLQLLCMPLVAFDSAGNRLGMGGGFYDRTLAASERYPNLQLMGIAHDCQHHPRLPSAAWDVPLPQVITPQRVWQFNTDNSHN